MKIDQETALTRSRQWLRKLRPHQSQQKPGQNSPCTCGGQKYKYCPLT